MDRLTAVRVFVEVADRGSLTQAAEHLDMSAAMVSRYLAAVEGWLGARLLHRTTRKLSLTDAGLAALPSCRQLLDIAHDTEHLAAERSREPSGVLRVTTAGSFAEAQLTAALVDSPEYLARHGTPRVAEDLRQHRCIAHAFGIGQQYRFTRGDGVVTVPVSWGFHTNETAVLRRAVLCGAGIGMLPTYYLGDDVRSGRLVKLLPDHEPEVLGIHAIYLSRRHH